jgi:ureidoacrylate peracid hydrolase
MPTSQAWKAPEVFMALRRKVRKLLRPGRSVSRPSDPARVRELLSPARAALLVVDFQNDYVHQNGRVGPGRATGAFATALAHINALIGAARRAGVPVVYVRTEHDTATDPGPYRAVRARRTRSPEGVCLAGTWGAEFAAGLELPRGGETVVTKVGYDGFATDELAPLLAAAGRDVVVVTGVATTLCVFATVAGAFERGLYVVVPSDATAASEMDAAHATLLRIDRHYGDVVPTSLVLEAWARRAGPASG